MAAWSGVRVVIAQASRPEVLADAIAETPGVGTVVLPATRSLPARKLWIAFALSSSGKVFLDQGARRAVVERDASLLTAGVVRIEGDFQPDDAVELADEEGIVFAKGIARLAASRRAEWLGKHSSELPAGLATVVVHHDDLVILSGVEPSARRGA
jgi:glutamate 5-kinase